MYAIHGLHKIDMYFRLRESNNINFVYNLKK